MSKWLSNSFAACMIVAVAAGVNPVSAQDRRWLNIQDADEPESLFQLVGMGGSTSYIGVNLADIDNDRAHALKLRDVHGVEISRIEENSPAAKAGLKVGDVVLEYNGQRVEGMEQFGRFVRETPVGREVKLLISREGNQQNVAVTVGARKDTMGSVRVFNTPAVGDMREFQLNMPEMKIPMPDIPQVFQSWRTAVLGVEAESLSPQLAEYFGVKNGALVRSVMKESPAEKAGIKAGDVITKVEQESIDSPTELSGAVRAAKAKNTLAVQIMRDRHEMTVNVAVDRSKMEGTVPPRTRIVSGRTSRL